MKKILLACDSFKGSLRSAKVVDALATGWRSVSEKDILIECPIADGGEGSLEAIFSFSQVEKMVMSSVDALGNKIYTFFLWDRNSNTAFVEMANVVGLEGIPKNQLNPLKTSTYGLGLVMKEAMALNVSKLVLFVGGSATNDMGIGAAQALGVKFLSPVSEDKHLSGEDLMKIEDFYLPAKLAFPEIIVATDVKNPLCGPQGASLIYGYQKGGRKEDLEMMDGAMEKLGRLVSVKTGVNLLDLPGGGAAGGIAAGMVGFFQAQIVSGAELIFDLLNIEEKIKSADLVITGEGKMDNQTMDGKLISRLSSLALKYRKPLIAVCGDITLDESEKQKLGISDAYSLINWTNNAPYSAETTILHLREIGAYLAQKYLDK